jgi:cytidylate kinase
LKKIIIAIDGPAASGKSTTAKALAKRLNYTYIDTGAMYRAITLKLLRENAYDTAFTDEAMLKALLDATDIHLEHGAVFLDGEDVSDKIRTHDISSKVSKVSSLKLVREKLTECQKKFGNEKGIVMDGRDIGTVIFPDADLKVFMTASARERAKRRLEELQLKGETALTLDDLEQDILRRDKEDSERALAPLRKAADAIELDTSSLSIDEQVEFIYRRAEILIGN